MKKEKMPKDAVIYPFDEHYYYYKRPIESEILLQGMELIEYIKENNGFDMSTEDMIKNYGKDGGIDEIIEDAVVYSYPKVGEEYKNSFWIQKSMTTLKLAGFSLEKKNLYYLHGARNVLSRNNNDESVTYEGNFLLYCDSAFPTPEGMILSFKDPYGRYASQPLKMDIQRARSYIGRMSALTLSCDNPNLDSHLKVKKINRMDYTLTEKIFYIPNPKNPPKEN